MLAVSIFALMYITASKGNKQVNLVSNLNIFKVGRLQYLPIIIIVKNAQAFSSPAGDMYWLVFTFHPVSE